MEAEEINGIALDHLALNSVARNANSTGDGGLEGPEGLGFQNRGLSYCELQTQHTGADSCLEEDKT